MKILHVLPRRSRFYRRGATSQDLFVAEVVTSSQFSQTTWVAAEVGNDTPLWPQTANLKSTSSRKRIAEIIEYIKYLTPDIVVIHQHLPTAAAVALKISLPVVLVRHNYVSVPETRLNFITYFRRIKKMTQLNRLSGIALVSHSVLDDFEMNWPDVPVMLDVIHNGIDFLRPTPRIVREREILCVGRATPQKGILEAAEATVQVLNRRPDWSATFILSECDQHQSYARAIRSAAQHLPERFQLIYDAPHDLVREYNERAAIAMIPSIWREPFGRTALEAHAGGAAVITSGTGGLAEISGPNALYLDAVRPQDIEMAIEKLILDDVLRSELAKSGWQRAHQNFDIGIISDRLDNFLDRVIRSKQDSKRRIQLNRSRH
jgi:glycosyltransferase involved in cell wall biosynthesis